jgi:glycerol-3-phosphate acyltransferase PlsY
VEYVIAAVTGYLLGSIPVALVVARRHGVDLYARGDGNPGAWNALEQLGMRRAWPAFAGDGLKGLLAGLAGHALGDVWTAYVAVAAAMVGHAFPLFARFRGGKAVMTFVGGAFALAPLAALISLAVGTAAGVTRRSVATFARVGVFTFPAWQAVLYPIEEVAATGALMCVIGALFFLRRRPGPATRAEGAGPTGSAA